LFSKFSADGEVFAFGSNFNGQLGLGVEVTRSILPTKLMSLEGHVISDVACGESHTAFVTGGRLFLLIDHVFKPLIH
jgi:alpha-tubulin suppressor-like RCC1 family protein